MRMTVWTWTYGRSYYLKRPWKWVKELFQNIRSAWMRATKGYCYVDVWEFNLWFTTIAPKMLRHMADYGSAYPGTEPFETSEKWHEWLYKMAEKLEECCRDYIDVLEKENEYSAQMDEILDKARARWREHNSDENTIGHEFTPEEDEIRKKYLEREKEIDVKRKILIQKTFTELGKYWDCLWD